jgi:hypothetical protein
MLWRLTCTHDSVCPRARLSTHLQGAPACCPVPAHATRLKKAQSSADGSVEASILQRQVGPAFEGFVKSGVSTLGLQLSQAAVDAARIDTGA